MSDRARLVTRAEVFQLLLRDKCVVGLSAVTSLRSCCSQRPFAWDTEGIVQCCCFGFVCANTSALLAVLVLVPVAVAVPVSVFVLELVLVLV